VRARGLTLKKCSSMTATERSSPKHLQRVPLYISVLFSYLLFTP
jgi:hypothetical protein